MFVSSIYLNFVNTTSGDIGFAQRSPYDPRLTSCISGSGTDVQHSQISLDFSFAQVVRVCVFFTYAEGLVNSDEVRFAT